MKHPIIIVTLSREAQVEKVRLEYSESWDDTVRITKSTVNGEWCWLNIQLLLDQKSPRSWEAFGRGEFVIDGVKVFTKEQEVINALTWCMSHKNMRV